MILNYRHPAKASHHVSISLLLACLAGCSTMPELTTAIPENWQRTQEHRQQIDAWTIRGKLGIQTENDGGSLDLFWVQRNDSYTIRMIAPLGQGTILIKGDAHGVSLKTAEGEQHANNVEDLLVSKLGIKMPVTGMRDWLRGLPMENKPVYAQRWDEQGQLSRLVQDGWNVEMTNYKKVGSHMLPHEFFLERDDRPELAVRLILRRWTLPDDPA